MSTLEESFQVAKGYRPSNSLSNHFIIG